MIIGVGCDLVDIRRIENMLIKYDERFMLKIFATNELKSSIKKEQLANFLAKRFAAKEAFVKALGLGFRKGIKWKDICLLKDELGKPYIKLSGEAKNQLQLLAKKSKKESEAKIHVSLSDEPPYAQAMIVLEI